MCHQNVGFVYCTAGRKIVHIPVGIKQEVMVRTMEVNATFNKIEEGQTIQWSKEKGQTMIYKNCTEN
jgi:hypothetical protein